MLTAQSIRIDQRRAVAWLSGSADAEQGAGAGRPTVVLLHGFPMDHQLWDEVVGPLQGAARVVAVDLPGFGESESLGPILTMRAAADWLAEGLEPWGIAGPIALVGLSMGGYIAMEFAAHHPDRLSCLVLCNTKAETDSAAAIEDRLQMADKILHSGSEPLAGAMPEKLLAPATLHHRPDIGRRLAEMMRRVAPASVAAAQRGMAQRRSHIETLRRLPVDLLCISGQQDALTGPQVMRSIAESAPRGRLEVLAAAGHVTPLEAPQAWIAAVLPFIAGR